MSKYDNAIEVLKNEIETLKNVIKSHKHWTEKTWAFQKSQEVIAEYESAIEVLRKA